MEYQYKALKIWEELNFIKGVSSQLIDIGNSHLFLKQYQKALEIYQRASKFRKAAMFRSKILNTGQQINMNYSQLMEEKK